jgi:hypothetical protein
MVNLGYEHKRCELEEESDSRHGCCPVLTGVSVLFRVCSTFRILPNITLERSWQYHRYHQYHGRPLRRRNLHYIVEACDVSGLSR